MTANETVDPERHSLKEQAFRKTRKRFWLSVSGLVAAIAYLAVAWWSFDVSGVLSRAKPENAATLTTDSVSYLTNVVYRRGDWSADIERVMPLTDDPEWMKRSADGKSAQLDLGDDVIVNVSDERVDFTVPGYGEFVIKLSGRSFELLQVPDRVRAEEQQHEPSFVAAAVERQRKHLQRLEELAEGRKFEEELENAGSGFSRFVMRSERWIGGLFSSRPLPELPAADLDRIKSNYDQAIYTPWLTATSVRFDARIGDDKQIVITRGPRVQVSKRSFGWEFFAFDVNHKALNALSASGLWSALFSDTPIDPEKQLKPGATAESATSDDYQSNAAYVWTAFLTNEYWQHGDTLKKLFETFLMAFLGTFFAALFALPLAFLGAKNFTPLTFRILGPFSMMAAPFRFTSRRLFDFLRGVDMVIWSLIFIRAFGLGPLVGVLAIALTDTGTLGKLFSEALENTDKKQVEGVQSTGASQVQRYRFGVIPQIMPVFISQSLYYLESNIRSATVIGALTGSGIGAALTQGIQTKTRWEYVLFMIILTVIMVVIVDVVSGALRKRLIHGGKRGASAMAILFAGFIGISVAVLTGGVINEAYRPFFTVAFTTLFALLTFVALLVQYNARRALREARAAEAAAS